MKAWIILMAVLVALALAVTFWCTVGYVAWHFIAKFW